MQRQHRELWTINAVAEAQHRTVHVSLSVEDGTTKVGVNYSEGSGN
mgnify:CR=1 FL=1